MGIMVLKDNLSYLKIIENAALLYKENLLNKNLLIVYKEAPNKYSHIEVVCLKHHFLHLTGVDTLNGLKASKFFEDCIRKKLTVTDFVVKDTYTTTKKMNVIIPLMSVHKNSRGFGYFKNGNGLTKDLNTDVLAGRKMGCMGFAFDQSLNLYVPNSLLEEDIGNLVDRNRQLVLVYIKPRKDKLYGEPCYIAKDIEYSKLVLNNEIKSKIEEKQCD